MAEPAAVDPAEDGEGTDSPLERTADLMGGLLQVPKEEADEVHRGRIDEEPTDEGFELPDDAPANTSGQSAGNEEHFCEQCGHLLYHADGRWFHVTSGTIECSDVSQWGYQPPRYPPRGWPLRGRW